ncbi:MAG TPA: hypothetical protein VF666_13430 [Pyrinomonadaceae bacterium]|jgi:hypothetical protein
MPEWLPHETSKHQDHVIAHVIGTTVLGYFLDTMAAQLVLDIGFVWTIYLDGEMGMLPEAVAVTELDASDADKEVLSQEIRALHGDGRDAEGLTRVWPAPVECLIEDVEFYANAHERRVLVRGEAASLAVEMSLATREIRVVAVA